MTGISFDVSIYGFAKAKCQNDAQQLDQPYSNTYSNCNVDVLHDQLNKCIVATLEKHKEGLEDLYPLLRVCGCSLPSTVQVGRL
jgi:hypothetical protein